MAKKKDRAFFICPRWNEIDAARAAAEGAANSSHVAAKTLATIKAGKPLARSTLRKALLAVRGPGTRLSDIDSFIVDQRDTP